MNAKACSRKYLALFILLTLASPILYAQQIANCEAVNTPASPSFDFTESISRWGSTDSFDLESTTLGPTETFMSVNTRMMPAMDKELGLRPMETFMSANTRMMPAMGKELGLWPMEIN